MVTRMKLIRLPSLCAALLLNALPLGLAEDGLAVGAWTAHGTAKMVDNETTTEHATLQSTGQDPQLVTLAVPSIQIDTATVRFRLKSKASGDGFIFWITAEKGFAAIRSLKFDVQHDDSWHDYEVKISPKEVVTGFRIDPAQGPGRIEVETITVVGADGQELFHSEF